MSEFFSVLTTIGKAALVNAAALGQTVTLTEMSVGDGNGAAVNPTEDMTELTNEVYRAQVNAMDVKDSTTMRAELVIPADQGGFYVREVGLFDDEGQLFAVANLPDTYKPALAEGAGRELTVVLLMEISDSEAVTLKIDPTVVLASHSYVAAEIMRHSTAPQAHPEFALIGKGKIGDQQLAPVPSGDLGSGDWEGWYFMNGDQYPDESPQGVVLNGLSTAYKTAWGIVSSGGLVSVPNAFDAEGRGYFDRPVDGASRQVGSVQGDAIRNITGTIPIDAAHAASGAFETTTIDRPFAGGDSPGVDITFDASRVVPTADENRPMNRGKTPAIYLGV